jgi:hypothetical protein
MQGLRHTFFVGEKLNFDAEASAAIAMHADPSLRITWNRTDATGAECTVARAGYTPVTIEYTVEMAQKSGQATSHKDQRGRETSPWLLFPGDMCRWAALRRALRLAAPDLLAGLNRNAIEGSWPDEDGETVDFSTGEITGPADQPVPEEPDVEQDDQRDEGTWESLPDAMPEAEVFE